MTRSDKSKAPPDVGAKTSASLSYSAESEAAGTSAGSTPTEAYGYADSNLYLRQVATDLHALKANFRETLTRLEPKLENLATAHTDLKIEVVTLRESIKRLPGTWTLVTISISSMLGLLALLVTVGAPKDFFAFVKELTNKPAAESGLGPVKK